MSYRNCVLIVLFVTFVATLASVDNKQILIHLREYNELKLMEQQFNDLLKNKDMELYRMTSVVKLLNSNMEQCVRKFMCKDLFHIKVLINILLYSILQFYVLDPKDPTVRDLLKIFDEHEVKEQKMIKSIWMDLIANSSVNCTQNTISLDRKEKMNTSGEVKETSNFIQPFKYYDHLFLMVIFLFFIIFVILLISIIMVIKLIKIEKKVNLRTGRKITQSPFWQSSF